MRANQMWWIICSIIDVSRQDRSNCLGSYFSSTSGQVCWCALLSIVLLVSLSQWNFQTYAENVGLRHCWRCSVHCYWKFAESRRSCSPAVRLYCLDIRHLLCGHVSNWNGNTTVRTKVDFCEGGKVIRISAVRSMAHLSTLLDVSSTKRMGLQQVTTTSLCV